MKTFKIIITNLILILALVILTSGAVVYADGEFTMSVTVHEGRYWNTLKLNNKTFGDIPSDISFYKGTEELEDFKLIRNERDKSFTMKIRNSIFRIFGEYTSITT